MKEFKTVIIEQNTKMHDVFAYRYGEYVGAENQNGLCK
jgi:hypothetical protein